MLRWLWAWVVSVGWYVVLVSGWVCWWTAHQRVQQLDRELSVMAHAWRYAPRERSREHV